MIRRPPRSTRLTHSFPTLRSSDLEWIKKAVIFYFPIRKMKVIEVGPFVFHDKMKLKTNYKELGVRVVPHGLARYGAFLGKGVILMPSYVNIGAYVEEGTMVDTWATVENGKAHI